MISLLIVPWDIFHYSHCVKHMCESGVRYKRINNSIIVYFCMVHIVSCGVGGGGGSAVSTSSVQVTMEDSNGLVVRDMRYYTACSTTTAKRVVASTCAL